MQLITVKRFTIALLVVLASGAGYMVGLSRARAEADFHRYDTLLSELGNQIFIYDALSIHQPEKAEVVLAASIESNFNALIEIFRMRGFADFHSLRCAITQRIRAFRKAGVVVGDDKSLTDAGYDTGQVNSYLAEQCPGEPKKLNWAEGKRTANGTRQDQK